MINNQKQIQNISVKITAQLLLYACIAGLPLFMIILRPENLPRIHQQRKDRVNAPTALHILRSCRAIIFLTVPHTALQLGIAISMS